MSTPVNRREFIHHSAGIAGLGAAPTYAMVDLSTLKCEIVPTSAD